MRELNIVVAGVGGQGQLFLSRIVGEVFIRNRVPAYIAETHGLSQRGGSVLVHIRAGRDVRAPLIPLGRGHIMVSLELIEAVRYLDYLSERGVALVNRKTLRPPATRENIDERELLEYLRSRVRRAYLLPASERAVEMGVPISANIYMVGALVKLLDRVGVLSEMFSDVIVREALPERARDANLKIYEAGKRDLEKMILGEDFGDLYRELFG